MGQVRRITSEVPLPESETAPGVPHQPKGRHTPNAEVYATAWPLSEDFYLCIYSPSAAVAALPAGGVRPGRALPYGIYLLDSFGNRELLYADAAIGCSDPIPLTARPVPPVLPEAAVADAGSGSPGMGEVAVMNVYDSPLPWPAGTRIRELRVINLFSKGTPLPDDPYIGHAAQSLARGVFGTAPVAEDGSAYFRVPAGTPVYFQALDERGVAVQTMRSLTYVRPGERLVCAGCHESKQRAALVRGPLPLALRGPPADLAPEAEGSYPLTFPRLVQPVLDRACAGCHERQAKAPSLRGDRFGAQGWSEAFLTLRSRAWGMSGGNGTALSQRQASLPGQDGALASALYRQLLQGHHDLRLAPGDLRRITLWLDCNSPFYGAYRDAGRQARGEVVLPDFGLPPVPAVTALVR
jgi:cytochrome c553